MYVHTFISFITYINTYIHTYIHTLHTYTYYLSLLYILGTVCIEEEEEEEGPCRQEAGVRWPVALSWNLACFGRFPNRCHAGNNAQVMPHELHTVHASNLGIVMIVIIIIIIIIIPISPSDREFHRF